ncbi:tetratricopeptide repeat protein [Gallaecimonas sp. GXIMD4217]|uniref:tetratricopeptide repeat protein n=1 Tax=Gallaecimonas sp. GXIMD4217 TaxID=3131927 RepID=UPI00311B3DE9
MRWAAVLLALGLSACAGTPRIPLDEEKTPVLQIQARAERAYKMARLDDAEALYMQVVQAVPDYAPGWFRLGNIYTRTGRNDAAIQAYQRCIKLEPDNQKAWFNLGLVRIKQSTEVLETATRMGNEDTPTARHIEALLDALYELQRQDKAGSSDSEAGLQ